MYHMGWDNEQMEYRNFATHCEFIHVELTGRGLYVLDVINTHEVEVTFRGGSEALDSIFLLTSKLTPSSYN